MSVHDDLRRELHEELQRRADQFLASEGEDDDREMPSTGVLTGWYLITEWAADDGSPWIAYHRPIDQAVWRSRGLLLEAERDC